MKRSIAVAASAMLLALLSASSATAAAVPSFTATAVGDQTMQLDASASTCEFGFCGYYWRGYDATRLGFTIGSGEIVSFRFSQPGWHEVVLTVSQQCFPGSARWCPASLAQQVFVPEPNPVVVPDPVPPPDPVAPPAPVVTPDPVAPPAPVAPPTSSSGSGSGSSGSGSGSGSG